MADSVKDILPALGSVLRTPVSMLGRMIGVAGGENQARAHRVRTLNEMFDSGDLEGLESELATEYAKATGNSKILDEAIRVLKLKRATDPTVGVGPDIAKILSGQTPQADLQARGFSSDESASLLQNTFAGTPKGETAGRLQQSADLVNQLNLPPEALAQLVFPDKGVGSVASQLAVERGRQERFERAPEIAEETERKKGRVALGFDLKRVQANEESKDRLIRLEASFDKPFDVVMEDGAPALATFNEQGQFRVVTDEQGKRLTTKEARDRLDIGQRRTQAAQSLLRTTSKIREVIAKPDALSKVGGRGRIRKFAQDLSIALGSDIPLASSIEELKKEVSRLGEDDATRKMIEKDLGEIEEKFSGFDPDLPKLTVLFGTLLSDTAVMRDPSGRISGPEWEAAKKIIDVDGLLANPQSIEVVIDTLDDVANGYVDELEGSFGASLKPPSTAESEKPKSAETTDVGEKVLKPGMKGTLPSGVAYEVIK